MSGERADGPARVALVTGASAGLGLALARALLAKGWNVVGVDREGAAIGSGTEGHDPNLSSPVVGGGAGAAGGGGHGGSPFTDLLKRSTAAPLHRVARASPPGRAKSLARPLVPPDDGGGEARVLAAYAHIRCDLADPAAVDALAADLPADLDLAVLCAGISATGRFEAIPAAAHARVLAVNAEAPLVLADALVARGLAGTLVLVASLSVDVGYPGAASYAASKDALAAYARAMRCARRAPRVLGVLPGPIRTAHAARHAPAGASEAARMNPDDLARRILRAVDRGARTLRPGAAARAAGLVARLAPGATARLMRRTLFERLDRDVW